METTATNNRLSSAKWSRNLNQDCQSEANRLRLLEKQRQLIESKLQRRQQNENISSSSSTQSPSISSAVSSSAISIRQRPATSIENSRSGITPNRGGFGGRTIDSNRNKLKQRISTDSSADSSSSIIYHNDQTIDYNNLMEDVIIDNDNVDVEDNDDDDNDNDRDYRLIKNKQQQQQQQQQQMKNRARTSIPSTRSTNLLQTTSIIDNIKNDNNNGKQQQQQPKSTMKKYDQSDFNIDNHNNDNDNHSNSKIQIIRSKSEFNLNQSSQHQQQQQMIEEKLSMPNPLTTVLNDDELLKFVTQTISPELTLQCTIIRDKKGLDRSLYPTYYMHLQDIVFNQNNSSIINSKSNSLSFGKNHQQQQGTATVWLSDSLESLNSNKTNDDSIGGTIGGGGGGDGDSDNEQRHHSQSNNLSSNNSMKKVFVLSGRRRKKSKTYLIGNNAFDISRDRCIAKLKSNVLGTQFTAIRLQQSNGIRYEISSITYETNVLGFKGPRKMTIIIPKPDEKTNVLCNLSLQEELKRNSKAILVLKNKTPIWNEETQSYVLNFHGRVTQASVKNFQLVVQNSNLVHQNGNSSHFTDDQQSSSSSMMMKRSSSSQHLRQNNNNSINEDDSCESDDDSINDDADGNDDNGNDGKGLNGIKRISNNNINHDKSFKTTTTTSTTTTNLRKNHQLSKSGYLMATTSEDAKQIADNFNDLVSLQFGRVSNTNFSCDVSWPLSLLQAFAIALSSFDSKLACE